MVDSDNPYVDNETHSNAHKGHRRVSKDKLTQYLKTVQLRQQLCRKLGRDASNRAVRVALCK